MKLILSKKIKGLFGLFNCVICGQKANFKIDLCASCHNKFQVINHKNIKLKITNIQKIYSFFLYDDFFISKLIRNWKFKPDTKLIKVISYLLIAELKYRKINLNSFDYLIAVPMHKNRLEKRGFNQSESLAKQLAQKFKIKQYNCITRVKQTKFLYSLNKKEREKNIKNAFKIIGSKKFIPSDKLLIVDDIITTGSTIAELTKSIKQQGAKNISVLSLAITRVNLL